MNDGRGYGSWSTDERDDDDRLLDADLLGADGEDEDAAEEEDE